MAIFYSLDVVTPDDPDHILTTLVESIPSLMRCDDYPDTVAGPELTITCGVNSAYGPYDPVEVAYGFLPTVILVVHFYDFDPIPSYELLVSLASCVALRHQRDFVLLFNGEEPIVLQRAGVLRVNASDQHSAEFVRLLRNLGTLPILDTIPQL